MALHAITPALHHLAVLGIKGLLLVGGEFGIESLDGVFTFFPIGLTVCHVLGAQGTHLVDALWRGQFVQLSPVGAGHVRACWRLHGRGERGPTAFLGGSNF